jgi:enamine deaminase RidA (YjgF/YER057c/UK114 family)
MKDITHLPMGLMWQMPIPVACSLAVAAKGLAVSCGQCPFDTKGQVLHPGDAGAQAGLVAGMAQGVLSHLPGHYPAILVVYHDAADESEVLAPLRGVFPDAVLLPVRLPHFYYPGMRIEVDLYALATPPVIQQTLGLSRISGGPLELVALRAGDMAGAVGLLAGLDPARLLSAQWFAADPAPHDWHPDPAARVVLPRDAGVSAVLTLAPDPVQVSQTPGGAIKRASGCFVWMSAQGHGADLAAAAHQAMDALALDRQQNLTILKATTHYVGGAGPEDLHGNLAVRHARFPMPGPASTGVPVAGLAGGSLAIDMLGIVG